jgi:hypothetical protein
MHAAVKLSIHVPEDHVVKLPDEVPVGQAEMIILVPASKAGRIPSQGELDALAYFMRPRSWTPPPGSPDSVEWLREDRAR